MALNLSVPEENELRPRITVFGVGGAGGNAVNNMIEKQLEGVEFVVANTDAQALQQNQSASRIQLGVIGSQGQAESALQYGDRSLPFQGPFLPLIDEAYGQHGKKQHHRPEPK